MTTREPREPSAAIDQGRIDQGKIDHGRIVEDIVARLRDTFEPRYPSATRIHETPPRMTDNGNTAALRVEVEGIKAQFHDFREETNARFSSLQSDIRELSGTLGRFIQGQSSRGGESLKSIGGMAIAAMGVTLTILGAFGTLAKTNLDTNIAFTNDKIGAEHRAIDKLAETVAEQARTTVPRYELDFRIGATEKRLDGKVDADLFAKAADMRDDQVEALRDQLDRLEGRVAALQAQGASKSELQSLNERLSTLSNRLSGFAEKFTAVPKDPRLQ